MYWLEATVEDDKPTLKEAKASRRLCRDTRGPARVSAAHAPGAVPLEIKPPRPTWPPARQIAALGGRDHGNYRGALSLPFLLAGSIQRVELGIVAELDRVRSDEYVEGGFEHQPFQRRSARYMARSRA